MAHVTGAGARAELRRALLERFAWTDGHADFAAFLSDSTALGLIGPGLARPFRDSAIDLVVGLEARGFVLGALVAAEMGVGLVLARKAGAVHPGPKVRVVTAPDWRGRELTLEISRVIPNGARVLLVDDWIQTGAQALGVVMAVEECQAEVVGGSVLVDDRSDDFGGPSSLSAVVRSADLGGSTP